MSFSKDKQNGGNIFEKALQEYIRLLQYRPVITKSISSAVTAGLAQLISQLIVTDPNTKGRINWRSVFAYTSFGFVVSGPLSHHLYLFLENQFPREAKYSAVKRLLFDRLIFAPPYLLIFLYYVAIMEGFGQQAAIERIKNVYWMLLKMNLTVWTLIQYINVNYVPLKFRTIYGNLLSLVWIVFMSVKRRQALQ